MPSYLDFNSSKRFRDFILGKTLKVDNGPLSYTSENYIEKNLNEFSNKDLPPVDANRNSDLTNIQKVNTFKPNEFDVIEDFRTLERKANLSLYPYFKFSEHNIIGIMSNNNFDTESELFKFAASYIKDDPNGPVHARIRQNLEASTVGRIRLIDALNGSTATAANIVTGREPLVESNYRITVAKTALGKGIDFLQTVAGVEFPWSEIPGDYLTNPDNPINNRTIAQTETGAIIQDVTGALGSLIGIQRRPTQSRKPSDLMIEYMGQGQKNILFDLLSYSTYGPNYTTRARSQNSSKVFNFVDTVAQGVKNVLGLEAPDNIAYIGDDRSDDVKLAMGDMNGNQVRSPYYLTLMFDSVQAELFHREKNITEGGPIPGVLTWISRNSRNKLGAKNAKWSDDKTDFANSESTRYNFRYGSILERTQEILDSMPTNGGEARSHVGNVIDQTSRFFKDGDKIISRGSNVRYVDSYGVETGVELCRVWTKDRPYYKWSDTMRRTETARKFSDSVLSKPWNLNICPISDGKASFDGTSTNIFNDKGDGFYAKKYMFSIENLAWKASNTPGFTYNDLPACERGNNGGRVMWFPPYDLKVTEQSNVRWEPNSFLGRPEPIYTYQNTERTGQVSFKVIVDHPSILNLLVKEHFKGMSDEQSENAINAFFSGCKDLDFYDLITRYQTLSPSEIDTITDYLNNGDSEESIKQYSSVLTEPVAYQEDLTVSSNKIDETFKLYFLNDSPDITLSTEYKSATKYSNLYNTLQNTKEQSINSLTSLLTNMFASSASSDIEDLKTLYAKNTVPTNVSESITTKVQALSDLYDNSETNFNDFDTSLDAIKQSISDGNTEEIYIHIGSATSACAENGYNELLSIRRSNAIYKEIIDKIKNNDNNQDAKWDIVTNVETGIKITISFRDLGYEKDGNLIIVTTNVGEDANLITEKVRCGEINFNSEELKVLAPEAFKCRLSSVKIVYTEITHQDKQEPTDETNTKKDRTKLVVNTPISNPSYVKRPPINTMKKIVTKTLSECFYFKKLEDTDPVIFSTLREKLKYFHPSFHSMTPEGLNSRLTFLQQCLRPGDTIPIKGVNSDLDLTARNTSFGAPPICVLRIGDFFNTKIAIGNINISYEDGLWDLNPEGIGIQPMIANVTMQVNFIGGSGLKEPVSRLQNALSSNFYANTEMYDERAESTANTVAGKNLKEFTKEFLEQINRYNPELVNSNLLNKGNELTEGTYLGEINSNILSYKKIINDVFDLTKIYFDRYPTVFNSIYTTYGNEIAYLMFSPDKRSVNEYKAYNDSSYTNIEMFGEYPIGKTLPILLDQLEIGLVATLNGTTFSITDTLGLDKVLDDKSKAYSEEILKPVIQSFIEDTISDIRDNTYIKDFISVRNKLISSLDKVNFLKKYEFDAKIVNETVTKTDITGFDYSLYSTNIDYIVKNNDKFYDYLEIFDVTNITEAVFIDILKKFLYNNEDVILDVFKNERDRFTDKIINKITNKIGDFVEVPGKEKTFRFSKFKEITSANDVIPSLINEVNVTDQNVIDEVKLLYSSKVKITDNLLNYYKQ